MEEKDTVGCQFEKALEAERAKMKDNQSRFDERIEKKFDDAVEEEQKREKRGSHWAKKRAEERGRFNAYRVPKGEVDVLLFVSQDGLSIGLEIENLVGLFTGNNDSAFSKDVEKRAKELGFELVQLAQQRPKCSWRSMSAKRMWQDPTTRARLLKNLEKARAGRRKAKKKG